MTPSEAAFVLAHAAIADKRTIGELEAKFWARMVHPDVTVDDAIQAVAEHYAETSEWLMPADINDRARRIAGRRIAEQRRAEQQAQIDAENPPTAAVTDKARPLAALMAGTPIKAAPRGGYDGPTRRVRDNARAEQARAELDQRRATPSGTTPEHPNCHNTPEALR